MYRKVYYGEYSLAYWIKLMMTGNIMLPPYQRYFVWDKDSVGKLIESLKEDLFVPPVIIGHFKIKNQTFNYILDGQQRLTSVLLAYFDLFPKQEQDIRKTMNMFVDENDDDVDIEEELKGIQEWTFSKLLSYGKSAKEILYKYPENLYEHLDCNCSEDFFNSKFLAFAYIVPGTDNELEQQKFYSSVFRNINIQGQKLFPSESRKALYYLNSSLEHFFSPTIDFIKSQFGSGSKQVDFVKYLSLLSQYSIDQNARHVSRSYPYKKAEAYYEKYIYAVISDEVDGIFKRFTDIFPNSKYQDDMKRMIDVAKVIFEGKFFSSTIELDMYLFGLIYYTMFQKVELNSDGIVNLCNNLDKSISDMKKNDKHRKNPSQLQFLRLRLSKSLEIYSNYVVTP